MKIWLSKMVRMVGASVRNKGCDSAPVEGDRGSAGLTDTHQVGTWVSKSLELGIWESLFIV